MSPTIALPEPETVFTPPTLPTDAERAEAAALPLDTRFELGPLITGVQQAFMDAHGFLLFSEVAEREELDRMLAELDVVQARWVEEGREQINGVPILFGEDEAGAPYVQRFAYTSTYAPFIHEFVRDARLNPVRSLVGEHTRVGDTEKDGVVFNRYIKRPGTAYSRLGWHTDSLRDLFMVHPTWPWVRMPGPQLNVGLHFDRIEADEGCLQLIPGSHAQGAWGMMFRKLYFASHAPDPDQLSIATRPGDLTVHDGRMWHRVVTSPHTGAKSLRRTMYVPYLVDTYQPKSERSGTAFYHKLGRYVAPLVRTD